MGLIAGIVYASTAEEFFVYGAEISGARYLTQQTIYDAAGVHEMNIFWLRADQIAERIRQLDGIKAVHVDCGLPSQLTISVEEREPVIMWRAASQKHDWWLDIEGVVLPYHGDVESPETIFVVDSSERNLNPGMRIGPADTVESVLQLAAAVPQVKVFFYEANRGLHFSYSANGNTWPVFVGDSVNLERKIQAVQSMTAHLVNNDVRPRFVDVRWAEYPVFGRPAAQAAGTGN
jgi:hypothetical protein